MCVLKMVGLGRNWKNRTNTKIEFSYSFLSTIMGNYGSKNEKMKLEDFFKDYEKEKKCLNIEKIKELKKLLLILHLKLEKKGFESGDIQNIVYFLNFALKNQKEIKILN